MLGFHHPAEMIGFECFYPFDMLRISHVFTFSADYITAHHFVLLQCLFTFLKPRATVVRSTMVFCDPEVVPMTTIINSLTRGSLPCVGENQMDLLERKGGEGLDNPETSTVFPF